MRATAILWSSQSKSSPHAMLYKLWAKPVGRSLSLLLASYYTLYWTWEWLEKGEQEYEQRQKRIDMGQQDGQR
ncbi:LAME_0E07844g1_1 [Lachancea meyersii CBS 8951]|uniref:LAME_0E07844g1_1 n=1 Tax=Lachancea meyersii CBS 8951 TaxID=1266667 RepID=A0A1G4JIK1_9SACH|nr:LAME_0E07844g1_1 [Lachancea meyersii CBS 8951]